MTIYLLAERIYRIYSGGTPNLDSGLKIEDIKHLVVDVINRMLKTEAISVQGMDGTPTNLMLAKYTASVTPTTMPYGTFYSVTLPVAPVSLPLNKGVWYVKPLASSPGQYANRECVPLQMGQYSMISGFSPLVSDGMMLGNYIYEVLGDKLQFYSSEFTNFSSVELTLVVANITELGDFDLLPIPADYVNDVIANVLQILGVSPQVEDVTNDGNKQR